MNRKLALVTLALAAPLRAQEPAQADSMRHPMMGAGHAMVMNDSMVEQMGPAMMRVMLYTPQHLLARKAALGLTEKLSRDVGQGTRHCG